jgi:hypothetical protein
VFSIVIITEQKNEEKFFQKYYEKQDDNEQGFYLPSEDADTAISSLDTYIITKYVKTIWNKNYTELIKVEYV